MGTKVPICPPLSKGWGVRGNRRFPVVAMRPNCEKPLRAFTTTLISKGIRGTRLIAEPNGKNVKDWAIRSQDPKLVMIEYG